MKVSRYIISVCLSCITLSVSAQNAQRSVLYRNPAPGSFAIQSGSMAQNQVLSSYALMTTAREKRFPEESLKRKAGIAAMVVGSSFLVTGPILLGYGVTGYKRDKAAGIPVAPGYYAEISAGSVLMAFGTALVIRSAIAIAKNNKILQMGRYARKNKALTD